MVLSNDKDFGKTDSRKWTQMNINIIILNRVYWCSSPARHRSRSGEAGGVVSPILFSSHFLTFPPSLDTPPVPTL